LKKIENGKTRHKLSMMAAWKFESKEKKEGMEERNEIGWLNFPFLLPKRGESNG